MKKIDKIMNKQISRKKFIKLVGIGMIGLLIFPNLINYFLKNKIGLSKGELTVDNNKIYLDDHEIMEVTND